MRLRVKLTLMGLVLLGGLIAWAASCTNILPQPTEAKGQSKKCLLVEDGFGPEGKVPIKVETVVTGLEVPWGLAFISARDLLVTERPGRLRLIEDWQLVAEPVAAVAESETSEGGLLGIVLHPQFSSNRWFYLYRTVSNGHDQYNRVERWRLDESQRSAKFDRLVIDRIPAATYHNGGRLRFGSDGMLYVGTGDARNPESSQDPSSLAGKLLRVTPEGKPAPGNPSGTHVYMLGLRNLQAFDWIGGRQLILADHGPSGEMMRFDHDEVSIGAPGDNLGWPGIYGCDAHPQMISPLISWDEAVPPGGAAIYHGSSIPNFRGNLLIASLGARHLHRVVLDANAPGRLLAHEVYLRDAFGRLREAIMGPDGHLYVTTSNCDSRGQCPQTRDAILRITGKE